MRRKRRQTREARTLSLSADLQGQERAVRAQRLSQVKPPAAALAPKEEFIGPVFDDSGIRFFLVYNAAINNFLYILDETVKVADDFVTGPRGDRILVGKRTGFVFYRDHRRDRKILIGVYEENVDVNNYFDGPFDQLPDNFIEGETLRNAILKVQPNLKGKIDRFGGTPDGEMRYTIGPYLIYRQIREFNRVDRCAGRHHISEVVYYRCFIFDHEQQNLHSQPGEPTPPSDARKWAGGANPNRRNSRAVSPKKTGRTLGARPILSSQSLGEVTSSGPSSDSGSDSACRCRQYGCVRANAPSQRYRSRRRIDRWPRRWPARPRRSMSR